MWKLALPVLPVFLGILIIAKALRNVFFHPLRTHPGPKLWAATRLPWCWYQYRGRLNHKLVELHNEYGTVVRVAPNELSYSSETAWKAIYGQRSVEMKKDPIFSLVTPTGVPNIMTADRLTHSRHRRLLSHAFSEKALREQEDVLVKYSTKLFNQLECKRTTGLVDLTEWFHLTTFDLIGSLAFGQDFACVDTGKPHPFVAAIKHVSRELIMSQMATYYGAGALRKRFFLRGSDDSRLANARRAKQMVDARVERGPTDDRKDFWHYVLAADESKAKNKGLSPPEMVVNAFSIAIAGSDGTATTLTAAAYLLMTHEDVHRRLRDGIRKAFDREESITSAALAGDRIPLLDAVLNESMRLYPPVAVTLPRVVPERGATIDGVFVPAGTTVGINHLSAYHSMENFHRADEFVPERWLVPDGAAGDIREAFQPFSVGPRSCLGKNLAKAEMRMILARLLWRFDLDLAAESENWIEGQKIYGFWVKPALMCRLSPRVL
ncbi:cytochrome P450 [Thelonectria olida]|uniref:Cytochrome P450 n=1 Tax=Thelonectria olida TaxID=1576542 RepID=A0A9P8WCT9_9HYPO|nr:cytochrome P450 [Thelonectria olida]